ncbi:MAG: EscU/YscU/HrcU family type III secretion system export apparatus switch protein [Leptospiraceae bacterium]|jgi:flagellar biosynthesis protein|nr:EscU/YscU/HrcU family type III secretion system export apparatus switch protein [Leptospiraceae bacterium]
MIAVALKFLPEKDSAPIVVASGSGFLGERISEIAMANDVPIVKDEGLSSTLLRVPVGQEIPETLYKSVAVVFSFLYKLENELKSKRI